MTQHCVEKTHFYFLTPHNRFVGATEAGFCLFVVGWHSLCFPHVSAVTHIHRRFDTTAITDTTDPHISLDLTCVHVFEKYSYVLR